MGRVLRAAARAIPALAAALLLAAPAAGEAPCATRLSVSTQLALRHKELPIGFGIAANGMVVEIWKSTSGSWTVVATTAEGISCVVASGHDWETMVPKPGLEQ